MSPDLSLVVPAFNEEQRLPRSLDRLISFARTSGLIRELIVVDDGSTDATCSTIVDYVARAAEQGVCLRLVQIEHRGKGAAVRAGMARARSEIVGYCDADLSAGPDALMQVYDAVKAGADVAVASRGLPESVLEARQPWYRERAGRLFNRVLRALAGIELRDTQCGMKLFRQAAARNIFRYQRIDGFAFDAELVVLAIRLGYRVDEIGVRWAHSPGSKVSMVRDSWLMSRDVLRIVRRLHHGEMHTLGVPTRDAMETLAHNEETHWWHITKRRLVVRSLAEAGTTSGRYLDVGCGGGAMLSEASKRLPVFGVDLSGAALAHTRDRGLQRIAMSDAAELPLASGSFAAVSALDVLEHSSLPGELLKEFRRVLEPGGRLVITVPSFQWMWSYADHVLGHYRRYTRHELARELDHAGFFTERITYFHSWLLPVAWTFRRARSLLGKVHKSDDFPLPAVLNRMLLGLAAVELRYLARSDLPFGLSLIAVARRGAAPSDTGDNEVAIRSSRRPTEELPVVHARA